MNKARKCRLDNTPNQTIQVNLIKFEPFEFILANIFTASFPDLPIWIRDQLIQAPKTWQHSHKTAWKRHGANNEFSTHSTTNYSLIGTWTSATISTTMSLLLPALLLMSTPLYRLPNDTNLPTKLKQHSTIRIFKESPDTPFARVT